MKSPYLCLRCLQSYGDKVVVIVHFILQVISVIHFGGTMIFFCLLYIVVVHLAAS